MPEFDRIAILDWSAAGRPVRGANTIWLGCDDRSPANPPTRQAAAVMVQQLVERTMQAGQRLLIGADFAFGHPSGLALRITGQARALALWDHLQAQHHDNALNRSNYRTVAADLNRAIGAPVFWGDGRKVPTPGLPRLKPPPHPDLRPHRVTETPRPGGPRPKSPFQLAGAGAVGAQSLTGIPWLNRLRRHPGIAVWPFEDHARAPVVLAEVYPSMLGDLRGVPGYPCLDAAQVDVLAQTLRRLDDRDALAPMLVPDARIVDLASEGQILGFGHEPALRDARGA